MKTQELIDFLLKADAEAVPLQTVKEAAHRMQQLQTAFNEWHDKTGFIQDWMNSGKLTGKYLGMHRADVMRDLIEKGAPVAPPACPTDVCQAGKADGVLCANDECDRASGVRPASAPVAETFQARVQPWMMDCFGPEISADRQERNHRFIEEALELIQACGATASEAHQLVDYVFNRPVGDPSQEVGGVMVTLAALCLANGLDMHQAGDIELARISAPAIRDKIRAKQASKPKHSPLPESAPVAGEAQEPYAWVQEVPGYEPRVFLASRIEDPRKGAWRPEVKWRALVLADAMLQAGLDAQAAQQSNDSDPQTKDK